MSKVTTKYQITIPPEVREQLGILPGTKVDIHKQGKQYVLVVNPIAELKKSGGEDSKIDKQRWFNKIRSFILHEDSLKSSLPMAL